MEQNSNKDYFASNVKILQFALKQWKFLGSVAVIAAILGIVFSSPSFIAPKFTAEAIIYPANLGGYSGETRLEQMLQYCESNEIRNAIISKFNLYDEYEIDSTAKSSKNAIDKLYSENVTFDETKYESIRITASSTDPKKSRQMVDEFIRLLDMTIRSKEREKFKEQLIINEKLLVEKKHQIDSLESIIREYSTKYGILDYIVQTEEVTKGYMKFLLSGKKGKDYDEVKQLYENLQKYGRKYHNINAQLNLINTEYVSRLHNYEHSVKDYTKVQTHSYVLVSAETPDKKSSPIRWLIVLMASFSAMFFAFVLMLFKGYNNK
ncbi:MAG: hypothetical protein DWP98_02050 [Bacteroidetes bacterium]|nr:MAG: hypothetical protein DWP98_02050 [Bacteroidota bacterium]MBL1145527.1 hypothetical protein [Bacteroidota bacterium]NOG58324.1 hypothetical protein [Bacteroidota bacterium]